MIFFTSDEHYYHKNIIRFCNRPFKTLQEMHEAIITANNAVVKPGDTVYHLGDFSFGTWTETNAIIKQLNGNHCFIKGSHDKWAKQAPPELRELCPMVEVKVEGQLIVLCHYAMRVWPKSHYGSWQLYGHSHGQLPGVGKQMDVGIDAVGWAPRSFGYVKDRMDAVKLEDYGRNRG